MQPPDGYFFQVPKSVRQISGSGQTIPAGVHAPLARQQHVYIRYSTVRDPTLGVSRFAYNIQVRSWASTVRTLQHVDHLVWPIIVNHGHDQPGGPRHVGAGSMKRQVLRVLWTKAKQDHLTAFSLVYKPPWWLRIITLGSNTVDASVL